MPSEYFEMTKKRHIVVIAILAAITIVAYTGISDRAKQSAAASEIQQAAKSLEANKVLNNATYALDWTAAQAKSTMTDAPAQRD